MSNPGRIHWEVLNFKRLLRYIKGVKDDWLEKKRVLKESLMP
jgi:hypothetical protein